jgi:plasmid stability protein
MATLTIRQIDDDLKTQLRQRAARNSRSMEEEARVILRRALTKPSSEEFGLGTRIRQLVEAAGGGFELELPDDPPYEPKPLE